MTDPNTGDLLSLGKAKTDHIWENMSCLVFRVLLWDVCWVVVGDRTVECGGITVECGF